MLEQLKKESNKVSLKMNSSKMKDMTNITEYRGIKIRYAVTEKVDNCIYLSHKFKLGIDNQTDEMNWSRMGSIRANLQKPNKKQPET